MKCAPVLQRAQFARVDTCWKMTFVTVSSRFFVVLVVDNLENLFTESVTAVIAFEVDVEAVVLDIVAGVVVVVVVEVVIKLIVVVAAAIIVVIVVVKY